MNLNGNLMDRIGALPIASDIRREYRLVCSPYKPLRPERNLGNHHGNFICMENICSK
jgi:hypothetical protein